MLLIQIQIQIQSDELYFVHHAELMIMTRCHKVTWPEAASVIGLLQGTSGFICKQRHVLFCFGEEIGTDFFLLQGTLETLPQ